MLELKNINKSFGSLQVLDNVSATFGRGEVVSIVGPSGAGKTTLLQIAGTLDKPDSGSVVDGVDVSAMPERKLSEFPQQAHRLRVSIPSAAAGVHRFGECGYPGADPRREPQQGAGEGKRPARDAWTCQPRRPQTDGTVGWREAACGCGARAHQQPRRDFADEPSGSLDSHNKEELLTFLRLARPFQPNVCHSDPRRGTCRNVRPYVEDARRTDY